MRGVRACEGCERMCEGVRGVRGCERVCGV